MSDHVDPSPFAPLPEGAEAPPPGARIMAVVRWLLVAAMASAAVWTVGTNLGWLRGRHAVVQRYVCPMHPQIVQDQPGECPICHMTLVPAAEHLATARETTTTADAVPGLATIDLTPERVQLAGVRTAPVVRKALGDAIKTIGTVMPSERSLAVVSPRFAGWVERVMVSETGRSVRKGQVLATVYSPDVQAAQEELLSAHRVAHPAPGAARSPMGVDLALAARRRLELLGLTTADIDAVLATGTATLVSLRAPRAGQVIARHAVQGAYVEPGVTLFELADLTQVWVVAQVHADAAAWVQLGAPAQVTVAGLPGRSWRARIAFIQPKVDTATRTVEMRLELDNRDLQLKPGMYADVTIEVPAATGPVVPVEAVIDTGAGRYVFVVQAPGRFAPRPVTTGIAAGDEVAVTSGLVEGEVVVTSGGFLLDSESRLKSTVPVGAAAPTPPTSGTP